MTTKTSRRAVLAGAEALPDAAELPVAAKQRRKPKCDYAEKAATQEERDSLRFNAIRAEFPETNDEWAEMWLPIVRLAAVIVGNNDGDLKEIVGLVAKAGELPNTLENISLARRQFKSLIQLLDWAFNRTVIVAERHGYSPDNPPSDCRGERPELIN